MYLFQSMYYYYYLLHRNQKCESVSLALFHHCVFAEKKSKIGTQIGIQKKKREEMLRHHEKIKNTHFSEWSNK